MYTSIKRIRRRQGVEKKSELVLYVTTQCKGIIRIHRQRVAQRDRRVVRTEHEQGAAKKREDEQIYSAR